MINNFLVLTCRSYIHKSASSRLPTSNLVKYASGDLLISLLENESRYYVLCYFLFIINIIHGCLRLKETVELS